MLAARKAPAVPMVREETIDAVATRLFATRSGRGVRPYNFQKGSRARPIRPRPEGTRTYRRAATIGAFGVSVPVGMVATFAPVVAGVAAAGVAINPKAFRTSISSFVMTSLLSFRN